MITSQATSQATSEVTTATSEVATTVHRGFAAMDPAQQREIASKGGRAAHSQHRAHEFTVEEARTAGRKGGESVSCNREHMAAIGRAGGLARGRNRALAANRKTVSAEVPGLTDVAITAEPGVEPTH